MVFGVTDDRSPPDPASALLARLELARGGSSAEIVEVDSGRRAAAAETLARAHGAGRSLERAAGPLRGERVVLLLPPGARWIEAFLGVLLRGGVAVPLPLQAPAAELAYFVQDSAPRLAIADEEHTRALPVGLEVVDPRALDDADDTAPSRSAPEGADPALMLYTSGTTGRPKGALLTHQNLAAQTAALRDAWGLHPDDALLHVLPMHHLHGVVVALLTALTAPCTLRLLRRFDARAVLDQLDRATVLMAVPTMYQRLVEAYDAASAEEQARWAASARALRLATSGSAALPSALAARWRQIAGVIPLERYGMTEIGMALSNPLDPAGRRPGTVGRALPTVDHRIVDEAGRDAVEGELWVRGPSVFAGYWGREAETAEAFTEGWFRTGDVGRREADGAIRLLGRTSVDILKTGGEKVSALEVEETLREHPAVAEVAVIGVPDPAWGDRVTAVVVPRAGEVLTLEVLRAWAKERLAPYKVPRDLRVVDALPRNAMGKVEKKKLLPTEGGGVSGS